MMSNARALLDYWEQNAPSVLRDAIGSRGLIVPLSQMSVEDLRQLIDVFQAAGAVAVTDRISLHYDEIFGDLDFLQRVAATWTARPAMKRRLPLLLQALRAHELRLYAASIPTLLAQFEGLVADIAGHEGRMTFAELQTHVATIAPKTVAGDILSFFVSDALLAHFQHGSLTPPFSRHAILHGGDTDYATEKNSRTAILLVDQITS